MKLKRQLQANHFYLEIVHRTIKLFDLVIQLVYIQINSILH